MHISDNKSVADLKKEFHAKFPYLKIEFFKKPHVQGELSSKKDLLEDSILLGDIRTIHNSGEILVHPEMTVAEVEYKFEKLFGVHVQIFRKAKGLWIETGVTDSWTLQKQNEIGDEMTS